MKPIHPASARALTLLAAIILVVGLLLPSPSGACFAFALAGVQAAVPALFGRGKMRLAAAVILLAAIGFFASRFPDLEREQQKFRELKAK